MVAGRSWLLVGIAICVALLVPAASSATSVHTAAPVNLTLLPLRKAQLGHAGTSLALNLNGGAGPYYYVAGSTSYMARLAWDVTKLGQGDSYSLDYGAAFTGCSCITEIRTSVERFRTVAIAKKRLVFWRRGDEQVVNLDVEPGFAVDVHRFVNAPLVGARRFAYFTEYKAEGAGRARVVDERFTDGRYVFQVEIHWGAGTRGITLASKLAQKLDERLRLARAGNLHAAPAKLPKPVLPGPPPGGPDLSTLAIQLSDLPAGAFGSDQAHYVWDPFALSAYQGASYGWAARRGVYQSAEESIQWYASAREAAFWSAYEQAAELADRVSSGWPKDRAHITSVKLDGGGRATVMWLSGGAGSFAAASLSRGHAAAGLTVIANKADLPAADVQALGRAMAARLDAGQTG
jgi:hypothetical protein